MNDFEDARARRASREAASFDTPHCPVDLARLEPDLDAERGAVWRCGVCDASYTPGELNGENADD